MSHINQNDPNLPIVDDPRYGRLKELVGLAQISGGGLHNTDISVAVCDVDAGKESPAHWHARTTEVYYIAEGVGRIMLDGRMINVKAGDACLIPIRKVHSIRALEGGLKMLVLTAPAYDPHDDFEIDEHGLPPGERLVASIAVVAGTHRRDSLSGKIARQICAMYREVGAEVELIDLAELPESVFASASYDDRYNPHTAYARKFIGARALHVVTPEYNGSYPGSLKHVLDAVPYRESFDGKSVCLTGIAAGDWGGLRAVDQLGQVFQYRSAHLFGKRVYVRNIDEAPMDADGNLTDPAIVGRIRAQVVGFVEFVRRLSD